MRYFRPNALSLAVAITISSSVIGTQALADRRLQIKSVDIQGNGHTEFTQSEVIVKPTLGDDQQPIPKTFTTTYPDQTEVRAGYDIPSEGFTDILSGIEGGISSIDQFETDENEVARKYTKTLKVGNEGVFRFTHNLAEEKLLIEVRESMIHQDSIRTVRAQLGDTWRLEPFTGIASPDHLVGVLKGANKRAGKLGEADHYVALAILEVDKVEVNRRTFMRLIAAGDQPPELQRLGQSLFVNDEVLLAAATSAYTQVHVLRKDLQQGILDDLLSYHKPVGYVVHVEDETQAYPVPAGYPKLEVTETPGEIIVFRGQKQNPTDVAFVEGLYYIWDKFGCNAPTPYTTARVKKDKVKSYKYVIRSRQMAMLEELSAQQNAGLDSGEQYDDKVATLAYYEHLQQALTSAASVRADEFKFTIPHVGFTSFYFMPTWMHIQFVKHFGFKPALRNFLTSWHFVQDIHEVIPSFNNIYNKYFYDDPASDSFDKGGNFVSKVIGDFAGQLIEMENELAEKQAGHIGQKIHEIKQPVAATSIASTSFAATGQPGEEALEEEQAAIESKQDMASDDENDPYTRKQSLQQQLRQLKAELADREQVIENSLADIESQLGLTPDHEKSPEVRFQAIKQQNKKQIATIVLQQQHLQHHLQNHIQQYFQHHLEQQGSRTNLEKEDEIRARYATIAAHLNIQDLDSNAGVDAQEEHLLQKLKTMDAQNKRLLQRVKRLNNRKDLEDSYTRARKDALAAVLGIDPGKDSKLKDRDTLERTVYFKLFKLARLQKELDDIKTPGHPKAMPEVLETLSNVEKALERDPPGKEFDVYLRRKHISEDMQRFIREARQRANEEALDILDVVERILNLEVNKEDDKTARLSRIHRILDADNLSDDILNDIDITLWTHNGKALDEKDLKLKRLLAHLHYKVEDQGPNKQATEQQTRLLDDVEAILTLAMNEAQSRAARLALFDKIIKTDNLSDGTLDLIDQTVWKQDSADLDDRALKLKKLGVSLTYKVEDSYLDALSDARQNKMLEAIEIEVDIYLRRCLAAEQRGMAFTAKLASDLDVAFEEDANLIEQKDALIAKIWVLIDEVNQVYEDESVKRARNNEMAYQLNIKDYKEDATIDDQNRLIEAKLLQLDKEVFKANQPTVDERIAAIEDELDKQMARLEPKPRYALDREVAMTRRTIKEAESELEAANHNLDAILREQVVLLGRTDAHPAALDEDEKALNQAIKKIQTRLAPPADDEQTSDTNQGRSTALRNKRLQPGGDDADADKIWQLLQEQASLEAQIEGRKADIGRMKKVLKAAEEAVENDGTPFQYTPIQAKILDDLHTFAQQHPLKQLALQAANGLAELALENGKEIPYFPTIDFDDEFAPIGLRAMVGDKLTFEQASWIVEVFKNLKTTFPEPPFEPAEDHPHLSVPYIVLRLTYAARHGIERGAQEYDDRIRSMGSAGIHYIEHLPGVLAGVLKSFPEYFATRSASGNKVIALLREGRISKTELENYMKAIRGVDGYQTVAEFEHFLGYKHGIKVPHFKSAIQMLSDKGAEEFMQSAFTQVTLTVTGPAGMKESVAGMKEYAVAVIANYVLDDIAFDNGRRTAAFLTNIQDTLTPYAHAAGLSESELTKAIYDILMQAHAAAVEHQLTDYWVKPSAFLVQAVTWYYSSYKPLLVTHTTGQAARLSLSNMSFLYLLDLTNRGDYLHRMLTPFEHWLERYGVDPDRTGQYAYHSGIEQVSEVGGLAMPLGKAASSAILLRIGSMLFARQYNANPHRYRSISRLVPEIVKSMGSGQGVQVPLLHKVTPQKVKTLASATAGLVLGPVATVGTYAHGLLSGFTYAQTFGFALASSLTFDFFMNDNKMLTQWLAGPLGRSLDKINRWRGVSETETEYVKRTAIATPQRFNETDEQYANRVKANNVMHGWTRKEHYLQFRERRDRTMKIYKHGWEKYFRENVPKWSFSHAESIPYSYTLGAFYELIVEPKGLQHLRRHQLP